MKKIILFLLCSSFFYCNVNGQTISGPFPSFFCPDLEASGGDQNLFSLRIKNLDNGSGGEKEFYVGSGNVGNPNGTDGERIDFDYNFNGGGAPVIHNVSLTIDKVNETFEVSVNSATASNSGTYSDWIVDSPNGLSYEDINWMSLGIREGSNGGNVIITNLTINGTLLVGVFDDNNSHWIIDQLCYGNGPTITVSFTMTLSGDFPNNEGSKVELNFGSPSDNDCGVPAPQSVGINTTPDPSAVLDINSTNKGVLLPRLTTAQRNAIHMPAQGLMIFNADATCVEVNYGTPELPAWVGMSCL